jgi:hypothetical protein
VSAAPRAGAIDTPALVSDLDAMERKLQCDLVAGNAGAVS